MGGWLEKPSSETLSLSGSGLRTPASGALDGVSQSGTAVLNFGGTSCCLYIWGTRRFSGGEGFCESDPQGLEGLDGTPLPLGTQAGSQGPGALQAPGRLPGQRAALDPPPPTWWPGREGARQLGEGGLCLPDSPVETAGVGGGPPSELCGPAAFPTSRPLPLGSVSPGVTPPPFPKPWDWRRGRWKASRSQPSPSGTQVYQLLPALFSGI